MTLPLTVVRRLMMITDFGADALRLQISRIRGHVLVEIQGPPALLRVRPRGAPHHASSHGKLQMPKRLGTVGSRLQVLLRIRLGRARWLSLNLRTACSLRLAPLYFRIHSTLRRNLRSKSIYIQPT